jgi:hypothetical protein
MTNWAMLPVSGKKRMKSSAMPWPKITCTRTEVSTGNGKERDKRYIPNLQIKHSQSVIAATCLQSQVSTVNTKRWNTSCEEEKSNPADEDTVNVHNSCRLPCLVWCIYRSGIQWPHLQTSLPWDSGCCCPFPHGTGPRRVCTMQSHFYNKNYCGRYKRQTT